jgi:cold-inducible RNA-binding protein
MPKVYVGNLAKSVTSVDLLAHFSRAGGALRALAVSDKTSGHCRGFGFVEMERASDVRVAVCLSKNNMLHGQKITIEPEPSTANGKARKRASA